MNATEVWQLGS